MSDNSTSNTSPTSSGNEGAAQEKGAFGQEVRASLESGVDTAREAIQNVPTKAWTIGAVVAGVAASVAIGAYVANNAKGGNGARNRGKSRTQRPAKRQAGSRQSEANAA